MKVDPDCDVYSCRFCGILICANCDTQNVRYSACRSCRSTHDSKKRQYRPKPNVLFQKLMDYGLHGFTFYELQKIYDSKILENTPRQIVQYYKEESFVFYNLRRELDILFGQSETPNKRTGPRRAHSVVFGPSTK